MKMPLFALSLTQNSARTTKSVYELLDTRKPWPFSARSAWTTPSTTAQFALPTRFQFSRPFDPSSNVVHSSPLPIMDSQPASASRQRNAMRFIERSPWG